MPDLPVRGNQASVSHRWSPRSDWYVDCRPSGNHLEWMTSREAVIAVTDDKITISPGPRFTSRHDAGDHCGCTPNRRFSLIRRRRSSPADDILDFGIAAVLVHLLGWHWEFLPSFLAKLVPGVDLVPFWTMAVVNVYRKTKRIAAAAEENREHPPTGSRPTEIPEHHVVAARSLCPKLLCALRTF